MNYSKLTFGDIMQSKILFYDKKLEHACRRICSSLHIDYLPSISGEHYFELIKGKYVENDIGVDKRFNMEERIFDENVLRKFELNKYNVLFVVEGTVLQGIVHISDYNQDIVIQAIQDDILIFERRIRKLLILEGLSNKDFFEFVNEMGKNDDFWKSKQIIYERRKKTMDEFGAFQMFDFSDLLHFFNKMISLNSLRFSSAIVNGKKIDGIQILSSLRNLAMHGKNPITIENQTGVFSMSSLQELFEKLAYLKSRSYHLLDLLMNNPNYVEAIRLDNASKLNIIYEHHPKALWYFIGRQ